MFKKIIYVTLTILLLSCNNNNADCNNTKKETLKYEKVTCPKCNGYGKCKVEVGERIFFTIVTLGPGIMLDYDTCDLCNGNGYVNKPIINN